MSTPSSGRVRLVILVAIVIALAAGGIAYASIPDSNGVVHTCYSQAQGTWRPIDYPTQKCKSGETQLDLNQTGPKGPPGPKGDTGPAGLTGPAGPASGGHLYVNANQGLVLDGLNEATVATLNLPEGNYLLIGKGSVGALPTLSYVEVQDFRAECDLKADGKVLDHSRMRVDVPSANPAVLPEFPQETIPFTLVSSQIVSFLNAPDTVEMTCQLLGAQIAGGFGGTVDAPTLTATKVDGIN